jgi:hypothetical protein
MIFTTYLVSERLRHERAQSRPLLFFFTEAGRNAAVMALVLAVMDVTPLALRPGDAWSRLLFVGVWSLFMAGWHLVRLRRKKADAHASSPG